MGSVVFRSSERCARGAVTSQHSPPPGTPGPCTRPTGPCRLILERRHHRILRTAAPYCAFTAFFCAPSGSAARPSHLPAASYSGRPAAAPPTHPPAPPPGPAPTHSPQILFTSVPPGRTMPASPCSTPPLVAHFLSQTRQIFPNVDTIRMIEAQRLLESR